MLGIPDNCVCVHSITLDHEEVDRVQRLTGGDDVTLKCTVQFCTCVFRISRTAWKPWRAPPDDR